MDYYPNQTYIQENKAKESYPNADLARYGAALRVGSRFDPALNKIPLRSLLANVLVEHKPNNYGVDPVKKYNPAKSRDDRNTLEMLYNIRKADPSVSLPAAKAIATLSTKAKVAERSGRSIFDAWNGGGTASHVQRVEEQEKLLPPEAYSALREGYGASLEESPSDVNLQKNDRPWYEQMRAATRDFTGGGY